MGELGHLRHDYTSSVPMDMARLRLRDVGAAGSHCRGVDMAGASRAASGQAFVILERGWESARRGDSCSCCGSITSAAPVAVSFGASSRTRGILHCETFAGAAGPQRPAPFPITLGVSPKHHPRLPAGDLLLAGFASGWLDLRLALLASHRHGGARRSPARRRGPRRNREGSERTLGLSARQNGESGIDLEGTRRETSALRGLIVPACQRRNSGGRVVVCPECSVGGELAGRRPRRAGAAAAQ